MMSEKMVLVDLLDEWYRLYDMVIDLRFQLEWDNANEILNVCHSISAESSHLYVDYLEEIEPMIAEYDNLFADNANKKALMRKHRKGNALHKSTDRQHGKNWYKRNNVRYYEDIYSYFREIPAVRKVEEDTNGTWYHPTKYDDSVWTTKNKIHRNRKTFRDRQDAAYKDRISEYK